MHLAKINWQDMQKMTPQAKINEVVAKVSRPNLGSQVVLGNKTLTGNRWQKTGLTCHSINQHKQCKQTEIRRWQSLHGSTSAFVHGDFGQHEVQRKLFCQTTCQHDDSAFKPFCSPAKICRWKNKRCTGWRHKNGCWFSSEVHWLAPQN